MYPIVESVCKDLAARTESEIRPLAEGLKEFLEVGITAMGRGTYYESRKEQEELEQRSHSSMWALDPRFYAVVSTLAPVSDRTKALALQTMLREPSVAGVSNLVYDLVHHLPPHRVLKAFESLCEAGLNRKRFRSLVRYFLRRASDSDLSSLWAIKYRSRLRRILTHVFGVRKMRRVSALAERVVCRHPIDGDLDSEYAELSKVSDGVVKNRSDAEVIAFVSRRVSQPDLYSDPRIRSYLLARVRLEEGHLLPPEVLEGIRSTYHPQVPHKEVIRITSESMSSTQRREVQRRASRSGVEVDWDPLKERDPIKLYIYAYSMGMDSRIEAALHRLASETLFPDVGRVRIVLDTSRSMLGSDEQRMRPIATVLAIRDVLVFSCSDVKVISSKDEDLTRIGSLPQPEGDTALAGLVTRAALDDPDYIIVLTDGYENRAAGRCREVVNHLSRLLPNTKVIQLSPVSGKSSGGIKSLVPFSAPVLDPRGLGLSLATPLLEKYPKEGVLFFLSCLTRGELIWLR